MFFKNMKFAVLLIVLIVFTTQIAKGGWHVVHGEVLQVNEQAGKILILTKGTKIIYDLTEDCTILRDGSPVSLASLIPIAPGRYQDVLCWLNSKGFLNYILVNYHTMELDGILLNYDIFGNLKE